jgi:hypothetical protein
VKGNRLGVQRGASLPTLLICLALLGVTAVMALRLVPVYIEHGVVKKALQRVADELDGQQVSSRELWRRLAKRLDVNNVGDVAEEDLVVENADGERRIVLEYEVVRPFLANIDFLLTFRAEVE